MEYIILQLPLPPSVNWLYAGYRVRHKSNEYKKWIEEAERELRRQTKYTIHGDEWLEVSYAYYMPIYNKNGSKKKVDVFNYEKSLSDFLEAHIEWFEDKKILKGNVEKIDSKERYVKIFIKEIWMK